jgi:ribosomal protein S18 acetylase RimI-like enzyme
MIRHVTPSDTPGLLAVCKSTGLFPPDEIAALRKLFDDYHATNAGSGHQALAYEEGGRLVAVVYFTPKEMTDRTWELLMIMVDTTRQGQGIGSRMLQAVEDAVRTASGRMLLIETSSLSEFEKTRSFYRKHGYTEAAHIPDYYANGVGKVSFTKLL